MLKFSLFIALDITIESTKTTAMEDVSTGVLEKIKNIWEVKIKLKTIWCIKTYIITYVKIQKNEDILSSMSNVLPNWCLKIDFQKVDQHAGGKWLIHDTKRHKDNQLQSLKLPCRISKLSSYMWHKGVRWQHVESDILKEGPGTETSWEVRDCRTPNT